jgi:hypothetical protein
MGLTQFLVRSSNIIEGLLERQFIGQVLLPLNMDAAGVLLHYPQPHSGYFSLHLRIGSNPN